MHHACFPSGLEPEVFDRRAVVGQGGEGVQPVEMADGNVCDLGGIIGKTQVDRHGFACLFSGHTPRNGVAAGGAVVEFEVTAVFADVGFGGASDMDVRALGPVNPQDSHFGTDSAVASRRRFRRGFKPPRDRAAMTSSGEHGARLQALDGVWNRLGVDGGLNTFPTCTSNFRELNDYLCSNK